MTAENYYKVSFFTNIRLDIFIVDRPLFRTLQCNHVAGKCSRHVGDMRVFMCDNDLVGRLKPCVNSGCCGFCETRFV